MKKKITHILKHPLFSGSALLVGGSLGINAINYAYHIIMGKYLLSVSQYGSLLSIFSVLYMISIVPVSSSFAIVKFVSAAKTNEEKAYVYATIKRFIWKIAIVGAAILTLSSPLIASFLRIDELFAVMLIGPTFYFSLMMLVNQSSMQGILKFIGVVGPNFGVAFFKLVLGVLFVVLGFSVTGAIGGVFLAIVLSYWMSIKVKGNLFDGKQRRGFKISNFLKYALPVLLQALAFTSFFTIDVILAKHFLPEFDAGLYAAVSTLGKIIFFAAQPVTQAMFPIVSSRRSEGKRYKEIFFLSFGLTVFISLSVVVFYQLFPNIAIGVLFGEKYLAASRELVWMGLFMTAYTASYILVNFLLSVNRVKIVILPLVAGTMQIIGIIYWHENMLQIIKVSLYSMTLLFLGVVIYLLKYQLTLYAKK